MRTGTKLVNAAWGLILLAGCLDLGAVRAAPAETAERRLAAAKGRIMAADYGADLAGLQRLRDEVAPLAADPAWGYLARYWAGFASWRLAINGASNGMSAADLRANLERASEDFEAALRLRADFADAYAAAAGVDSWLPLFLGADSAAGRERIERYKRLQARAQELAPDNPRVLWVEAVPYLYLPADRGGDPSRAVALYRRMVEVAGPPVASSPLPDWGKPEGLMSLAFAHLRLPAPDLEAAEQEARAALRLQPDWSYVKGTLLPQIEKARAAGRPASPPR
jgi:hypothetical protein